MDKIDEITINRDYLYDLLGCDELSTAEQITTEYKIKAKNLHPDKNDGDSGATEEFVRLTKAKEILCDKERRKKYDLWRNSGLEISFDTWIQTDNSNSASFHWAPKPRKEKMLESCEKEFGDQDKNCESSKSNCDFASQRTSQKSSWTRKTSWNDSKLNKFRNYMI